MLILGSGVAVWRWQEQKAASLAGRWRASMGKDGATTAHEGEVAV